MPKCRWCGEVSNERDLMYKHINGKQTMYFCNEHHFNEWNTSHTKTARVYDLIEDIFGYKPNNGLLHKELSAVLNQYGPELVADYLIEDKNNIEKAMTKDFKNDWLKSKYFMAIINNNMGKFVAKGVKKTVEKPADEIVLDYGEHKYRKIHKKSLMEVMEELNKDE